jgi:hypothetical protein
MKAICLFISITFLSGCGGQPQLWYNPGRTQMDFDRDSQECGIIAGELARQATLTGRKEDRQTFSLVYNNCINDKGWGTAPAALPSPASANVAQPSLARFDPDDTIEAFGRRLKVPDGFILLADGVQAHGDTILHNLLFQRGDLFINYTVQKSLGRKFEPTAYPVSEPFFLYEHGENRRKPRLHWAIFSGNIEGSWVTGLGGYFLLGKRERITMVVTRPLPPATGSAPISLKLTPDQFQAIEQFREEWLAWLTGQVSS